MRVKYELTRKIKKNTKTQINEKEQKFFFDVDLAVLSRLLNWWKNIN